jgi:hypothetical protein
MVLWPQPVRDDASAGASTTDLRAPLSLAGSRPARASVTGFAWRWGRDEDARYPETLDGERSGLDGSHSSPRWRPAYPAPASSGLGSGACRRRSTSPRDRHRTGWPPPGARFARSGSPRGAEGTTHSSWSGRTPGTGAASPTSCPRPGSPGRRQGSAGADGTAIMVRCPHTTGGPGKSLLASCHPFT